MIQSEQELENQLIAQLTAQDYAPVAVTAEGSMLGNLKAQLEAFNSLSLAAGEFAKVLNYLNRKAGVFEIAKTLRDRMMLDREDGQTVYLEFFDSATPLRNLSQVTRQVAWWRNLQEPL